MTTDHERIWLEPAGAPERCWCEDNQWGEEGVEYVRASLLETVAAERDALRGALDPFIDLKAQLPAGITAINKRLDGFTMVNVSVTKSQFLEAIRSRSGSKP